MKSNNLLKQPFYQKAINETMQARKEIRKLIDAEHYTSAYIAEETRKKVQSIKEILETGYKTLQDDISRKNETIKERYQAEQSNYTNPTEELLKRQDFDMKLKLMTDNELADYLIKALEGETMSVYEYQSIKLAIQDGKLANSYLKSQIETDLIKLEEVNHIGKEWMNDADYMKNHALFMEMRQIPSTYIWLPDDMGEHYPSNIETAITKAY